jgi:hypothetical protein
MAFVTEDIRFLSQLVVNPAQTQVRWVTNDRGTAIVAPIEYG